jgi:hypothetical protein
MTQPELTLETTDTLKKQPTTRAINTRNRILVRKAKAEETLNKIMPDTLEDGTTTHVISQGDIDSLSYMLWVLDKTPCEYILFSTWCMALADVEEMQHWITTGRVGRIDAYVGEIFPNQYPEAFQKLQQIVKSCGGRVAVFRNHAKVWAFDTGTQQGVIESSANINTNPRSEQTAVTIDPTLFDHYKNFYDKINPFNQSDNNWKPYHAD